jgi:hypothetical protein
VPRRHAKTQPDDSAVDIAREQLGNLRRYFALLLYRDAQEMAS